jgi:hypothetical protein
MMHGTFLRYLLVFVLKCMKLLVSSVMNSTNLHIQIKYTISIFFYYNRQTLTIPTYSNHLYNLIILDKKTPNVNKNSKKLQK